MAKKETEGCLIKKSLVLNQLKFEPTDAMLMGIPFRPNSGRKCTLLFEKHDKLK